MNSSWRIVFRLVALLGALGVAEPALAQPVTNVARGGVGGIDNGTLTDGGGTGRAQITLNAVDLALVKQARDLAGSVLPDAATVVPGQEIYFVLLVNNATAAVADDLVLDDPLDETQFQYVPGSLEITTVPAGSNNAQIWSGTWLPLTDDDVGPPADVACATDTGGPPGVDLVTVGAAPGFSNVPANVPTQSLVAVRFRVRVR